MKKQMGAGLIEALVAILVLSIGLMGMIGMQTASFRYEQTGWIRSALSNNVSGLADRIRANPESLPTAYSFSRTYAAERTAITVPTSGNTYLVPATNCDTTDCTPAQRAAYDLVVWRRALDQQMPGATGFVVPTGNRNVDLRYTVTTAWFDKDRVDLTDSTTLLSPEICAGTEVGVAARSCCPSYLGTSTALTGVRCTNVEVIP